MAFIEKQKIPSFFFLKTENVYSAYTILDTYCVYSVCEYCVYSTNCVLHIADRNLYRICFRTRFISHDLLSRYANNAETDYGSWILHKNCLCEFHSYALSKKKKQTYFVFIWRYFELSKPDIPNWRSEIKKALPLTARCKSCSLICIRLNAKIRKRFN